MTTKREALINYLKSQGIEITRDYYTEEKRDYQKPGTIVIHYHYLSPKENDILTGLWDKRFDDSCPIEVHDVRDRFRWIYGLNRIFFKKGVDWRRYAA